MAVEISWSFQAESDLQDLVRFVCTDGSSAGEVFVAALLEKIELLADFPQMGRVVPEADNPAYREVIHHNYRLIYRFVPSESAIEMMRIWHGARGTPDLL